MLKLSRPLVLLIAAAAVLPLAGCARGGKGKGDTAYVARDVSTLYTAAKRTMDRATMSRRPSCSTRSSASTPIRCGRAARS